MVTKVTLDDQIAQQIREGQGPIELIDSSGQTVGVVRRPPTAEEIARAKSRASRGGPTLTWAQLMGKIQQGSFL